MFWKKSDKPGWFGSKLSDYKAVLESGDYGAIPWVFCALSEKHRATKTAAAKLLCVVLDKLTFGDIIRIDEQMRQTTSMEWRIDWSQFTLDTLLAPDMSEAERRAVIVFASFNPNGFIREQAVRTMRDYAGTLPFVVLRHNDWVSQVRSAAAETADYRLMHLTDGELVSALPFSDKLSRCGRAQDGVGCVERMVTALNSQENATELATGLGSANIRTRRICTKALFSTDSPRYDSALDRLQRETDPFLRASIFRQLVSAGQNMDTVARQFIRDKYPPNRILAFQYIAGTDKARASLVAEELLLDNSAAVRENARFYLNRNSPGFDYCAYYKAKLSVCTAPALLGLGETGGAEHTAAVEGYLRSNTISVVRAAMTAVMRLDKEKYAEAITEFLCDSRDGIVTTARNLVIHISSPNYARIMEIFRATPKESTKNNCFSVLLRAGKWQRLNYILDVMENSSTDMAEKARYAINRWINNYNRSYAVATPDQIVDISQTIKRLDGKLSEQTRRQLLFLLR